MPGVRNGMNSLVNDKIIRVSRFFSIERSTLIIILGAALFKIMLDVSYYYIIGPVWRNYGFGLDIDQFKVWESYIFFFLMLLYIPKKSDKISHAVLQLFFLVAYVPMLTYYAFSNKNRVWFYCFTLFWFIVNALNRTKLRFSFRPLKEGKYINMIIMIVFSMLSVALVYSYLGFSFNLDLTKVYEIRRRYIDAHIPLSGYMINWTARIILPFIILLALFYKRNKRSYLLLFTAVIFQLFLFSSSGHKAHLFRIPAVIGLALLVDKNNFFTKLSIAFSGLIILGMLIFFQFKDLWIVSLFTRRVFLLPAQISFYYYEFFSKNNLVYLSHSIFKSFIKYPYEMDPAFVIGKAYFPESGPQKYGWANTGIVGDAYMNFGYIGVILWAILLATLLKIADAVTESRNIRIVWPILLMTFYIMVDGAPLTTLLTHGLILGLLVCYFTPKLQDIYKNEDRRIE